MIYMNFHQLKHIMQTAWMIMQKLILSSSLVKRRNIHLLKQIHHMGVSSIVIVLIASWFIGMIFTFQVARELTYLNASNLVGAILTITFLRELTPVLTAIIVASRIGSSYTAEIASMQVTHQIDVLYVLHIDPVQYLIRPRVISCLIMLPLLNILGLATSIASSIYIANILYDIAPITFVHSSFSSIYILDVIYSFVKTLVFGLVIGIISCTYGFTASGGSLSIGKATTASVVSILLLVFMIDFLLSLVMFHDAKSFIY
uniref:ABC transporter permease n=1 Tax=Hommersandiophycus borowitzkae TaxID=268573 RepID=A0A1G4NTT1_9FLOR|nr:Hypothetical protein ycf63 [Hommersandiophycus borowitzkae]SCW22101.1 Hypothetical protein ycf63 [Hommersandiophycus borowitzkae]